MIRFKIITIPDDHYPSDPPAVYVHDTAGERWCEVLGAPDVDHEKRARIIANALALYQNHIYPRTTPGSKRVVGYPQMELLFPEE